MSKVIDTLNEVIFKAEEDLKHLRDLYDKSDDNLPCHQGEIMQQISKLVEAIELHKKIREHFLKEEK